MPPQKFQIGLLRHIARGDGFARRIHKDGVTEDLAEVQAGIGPEHLVGTGHVLLAQRKAAAQKIVELHKDIAQALPHVRIRALNKDAGPAIADMRAAGCRQEVEMRIVGTEKLVG